MANPNPNPNLALFLGFLFFVLFLLESVSSGSVADQCAGEVTKVAQCLDYATGKQPAPMPACCSDVGEMRKNEPVCLCYIIDLTAKGQSSVKGIQVPRLLQLPSACKLANTSVADCPALLGLSPSSPDAAIFTSNSTTNSTTSGNSTTPGSGSAPPESDGFMRKPHLIGNVVTAVVAAVFFGVFSGRS